MASNPHFISSWVEYKIENGNFEQELVIETDLELRTDAPGFDEVAFNQLVQEAVELNPTGAFARVRVQPKRQ